MLRTRLNGRWCGYDDEGEGEHALLLIHGHPLDRSMWRPQIEFASSLGWRVIAPDLRGYGDSGPASEKTPLDAFADDLADLLDVLNVERAVVCGLSMGGQIAMAFCERHGSRVSGLCLAATYETPDTEEGKHNRAATAARVLDEGMKGYAEELLPQMLSPQSALTQPDIVSHVFQMMRAASPAGASAALLGRAERPSYAPSLSECALPALVVVGDRDPFTTVDDARRMHELLENSELVVIRQVGHLPNLEAPTEFNHALSRLLAKVSRAATGAVS